MNEKTATQLEMAAQDPAEAFGPDNLQPIVSGRRCQIVINPPSHVVVTDDMGAHHDFFGVTWPEIKASMTDYFWAVDCDK